MKIEIIARVIYVAPELSHNKLDVKHNEDGEIVVEYVVYDPSGSERNAYREAISADMLIPGKMYALVEFWDGYTLIEHRAGTYDGIFGAHRSDHKATFAVSDDTLMVLTNTPVNDAPNVTFVAGAEKFWTRIKELDKSFIQYEARERGKAEIAAKLDANASIAAVEAQLDVLSSLVIRLCGLSGVDASAYRDAIGDTSLLNLKSEDEILTDVRNRKALVRKLQSSRIAALARVAADKAAMDSAAADAEAASLTSSAAEAVASLALKAAQDAEEQALAEEAEMVAAADVAMAAAIVERDRRLAENRAARTALAAAAAERIAAAVAAAEEARSAADNARAAARIAEDKAIGD